MEFNYKYLYKTWMGLKITENENEVSGEYNFVVDPKELREIQRQLDYLQELREDSKRYILEINQLKAKNEFFKKTAESLKEENINLKQELKAKELAPVKVVNAEILDEKESEIAELTRQLNNLSSIINSKNRKVAKLENKVSNLENKVSKLENKKNTKVKKVENEVDENTILSTHKSLIIRDLQLKEYKVQKNFVLNIPLDMATKEIKTYVENIKDHEEELGRYMEEKKYIAWKVQTKNNVWELVLLKKELDDDDKTNIEFCSQSAVITRLSHEKSYKFKEHYVLPIGIEASLQDVKEYVLNAKTTNYQLAEKKERSHEVAFWKIQTKNNKWEVIFRSYM